MKVITKFIMVTKPEPAGQFGKLSLLGKSSGLLSISSSSLPHCFVSYGIESKDLYSVIILSKTSLIDGHLEFKHNQKSIHCKSQWEKGREINVSPCKSM